MLLAMYLEFSDSETDEILPPKGPKVLRCVPPRNQYHNEEWSRMLKKRECADPDSPAGKDFRRKFRVPMFLFDTILQIATVQGWCKVKGPHRKFQVPLPLKILGALRILGRGMLFCDVADLGKFGRTTIGRFFHVFCEKPRMAGMYHTYIYPPETPEDIARVTYLYKMVGLPGCIGSADVVHIGWDRCPAGLRSLFAGKKKTPTVAYEVTVDHRRRTR